MRSFRCDRGTVGAQRCAASQRSGAARNGAGLPCRVVPATPQPVLPGRLLEMTGKADFTPEEWELVLEGPPGAGTIVVMAERGGMIRESFSMAKAYTEARQQHGESELLDEVVSAKPEMDRTRASSPEQLKEHALQNIREAIELLKGKASDEEIAAYRKFILGLAERVAEARKEGLLGLSGERVSDAERAAIGEIETALG